MREKERVLREREKKKRGGRAKSERLREKERYSF